jgi:hypothetical protein
VKLHTLGQFERVRGVFPESRLAHCESSANRIERRLRRSILRRGFDPPLDAACARRAQAVRGPLASTQRAALEPRKPARDAHVFGRERTKHGAERDELDFQIADPG